MNFDKSDPIPKAYLVQREEDARKADGGIDE